jgi:hypothetical protein
MDLSSFNGAALAINIGSLAVGVNSMAHPRPRQPLDGGSYYWPEPIKFGCQRAKCTNRTNTIDPLGRKSSTSLALATGVQGTTAQSFEYDGMSRKTFARDSVGSVNADATFVFDSLSRVMEEVQSYGS